MLPSPVGDAAHLSRTGGVTAVEYGGSAGQDANLRHHEPDGGIGSEM